MGSFYFCDTIFLIFIIESFGKEQKDRDQIRSLDTTGNLKQIIAYLFQLQLK